MKRVPVGVRATVLLAVSMPTAVVCGRHVIAGGQRILESRPASLDAVVGSAATLGCWAVVGWIALTMTLAAAAALPGAAGAAAGRLAAAVTPTLVRRLVVVAVGVTVTGGATPAFAATSPGVPPGSTVAAERLVSPGSLDRAGPRGGAGAAASSDDWPSLDRPFAGETAVVEPGDCLWAIAAEHLEPDVTTAEIATEWPRWYAANRDLIGPDPNVIQPGQRLTAPPAP